VTISNKALFSLLFPARRDRRNEMSRPGVNAEMKMYKNAEQKMYKRGAVESAQTAQSGSPPPP
jgi:hypothetical protein